MDVPSDPRSFASPGNATRAANERARRRAEAIEAAKIRERARLRHEAKEKERAAERLAMANQTKVINEKARAALRAKRRAARIAKGTKARQPVLGPAWTCRPTPACSWPGNSTRAANERARRRAEAIEAVAIRERARRRHEAKQLRKGTAPATRGAAARGRRGRGRGRRGNVNRDSTRASQQNPMGEGN